MRMSTVNHQYLDHVILMSIERIQTWVTAETVQLRPQDPAHFATYLPSHSPKDCCGNFMGIWWCNNGFGIFWDIWITSGVLVLLGATASLRFLGPARSRSAPCELIPQRIAPIWLSLWACDLRRAFFPCPRFRQRLVWDSERTKETSRMLPLSDFVSGKTYAIVLSQEIYCFKDFSHGLSLFPPHSRWDDEMKIGRLNGIETYRAIPRSARWVMSCNYLKKNHRKSDNSYIANDFQNDYHKVVPLRFLVCCFLSPMK